MFYTSCYKSILVLQSRINLSLRPQYLGHLARASTTDTPLFPSFSSSRLLISIPACGSITSVSFMQDLTISVRSGTCCPPVMAAISFCSTTTTTSCLLCTALIRPAIPECASPKSPIIAIPFRLNPQAVPTAEPREKSASRRERGGDEVIMEHPISPATGTSSSLTALYRGI